MTFFWNMRDVCNIHTNIYVFYVYIQPVVQLPPANLRAGEEPLSTSCAISTFSDKWRCGVRFSQEFRQNTCCFGSMPFVTFAFRRILSVNQLACDHFGESEPCFLLYGVFSISCIHHALQEKHYKFIDMAFQTISGYVERVRNYEKVQKVNTTNGL